MKELEKTKRISIASVVFILVILIGFLTYKRPKYLYDITPEVAVENIVANDFLIALNELPNSGSTIIDIRSQIEFQKGHLQNAINIQAPELLNKENAAIFNKLKSKNVTAILYGTNPNQALAPYMVLNQLGYTNIKVATIDLSYAQNKLITKNVVVEKPAPDINAFIAESIKKSNVKPKPKPVAKKPTPKKVIPIKKKKKMPTEGGC